MKRSVALWLALLLVLSVACSTTGAVELAKADVPRASASAGDAARAADAVNAFGLDLYRLVAGDEGNIVVSPASIALALAMARAGARGTTADEMDAVLHDVANDAHASWPNALDQALTAHSGTFKDDNGDDHDVTLRIANSTFAQRGMHLETAYLEALASRFGSGVRLVDYATDAEAARRLVNGWVSEQTERRIPELLVQGILTSATRLTLVNAVYLKAPWQTPFPESATRPGSFTLADGATVEVPMMAATLSVPYAAGNGWQAVELPYVGGALAMTVIVPDDHDAFETALTAEALDAIVGDLDEHSVTLSMPKFGIETKAMLADLLAELGMPTAFDGGADFSGITADEELVISDVVHQANIDVDEKGTEAAAATAVVMRGSASPDQVTLHVDRPFLFALRDVQTGTVLFLGRVSDPSAGQ